MAITLVSSVAPVAPATAPKPQMDDASGAAVALFVLIVVIAAWLGVRTFVRELRARKASAAVGGSFEGYALEVLVNAARIDGRVNPQERQSIATAMAELSPGLDPQRVEAAFTEAKLTKDELIAYLETRSRAFSREQKVALLKALLAVFVADGLFDESEHAALVDYTAAIGFDRRTAPELLRKFSRDFVRGNIT